MLGYYSVASHGEIVGKACYILSSDPINWTYLLFAPIVTWLAYLLEEQYPNVLIKVVVEVL